MSEVVSIIGGGWSFECVDHSKVPGERIGVNDALIFFEGDRPLDAIVSMDRLWTEHRWQALTAMKLQTYLRRATLKNVPWDNPEFSDWLHTYECSINQRLLSPDPQVLNGRNSGAVALNLAFCKKPQTLFLFGFDMNLNPRTGHAHWHPPYPWGKGPQGNTGAKSYENWSSDFRNYADQFREIGTRVINVSPTSKITAFEKVSAEEVGVVR